MYQVGVEFTTRLLGYLEADDPKACIKKAKVLYSRAFGKPVTVVLTQQLPLGQSMSFKEAIPVWIKNSKAIVTDDFREGYRAQREEMARTKEKLQRQIAATKQSVKRLKSRKGR